MTSFGRDQLTCAGHEGASANIQEGAAHTILPVWHPSISRLEHEMIGRVLEEGYLGHGRMVFEFEDLCAKVVGVESSNVVAVATGYAALHLIFLEMGLAEGDEVITPSFNNVAAFQAISAVGANVVFCDVSPENGLIDLASAERLIGTKTKALLCLDYASQLCDLAAISGLCKEKGIMLVYDAAHSFGSVTRDRVELADFTMFSFDPIKSLTAIDAGVIYVREGNVVRKFQDRRFMGMTQDNEKLKVNERTWDWDVELQGFRYHLSNVHAAVGVAQIMRIDELRGKRNRAWGWWTAYLEQLEWVSRLPRHSGVMPFMCVGKVEGQDRDALRAFLDRRNIQTGVHWKPGHLLRRYRCSRSGKLDGVEEFARQIVSLPFFPEMTEADVDRVTAAMKAFRALGG